MSIAITECGRSVNSHPMTATLQSSNIPLEDFFSAYYECRKHKRRTTSQMEFELNMEENLISLCEDVNSRRYDIGRSICFCITRPKLREVFAASFRDRIVHHIIMQRLEPLFEAEFIDDNYNCRKGKGVLYGVERLRDKMNDITDHGREEAWIAKFDIRGFFMAIDKRILLERLRSFIDGRYFGQDKYLLLWLVENVVTHEPQNNCTRKGDVSLWGNLSPSKSLFTCKPFCGLPIGNLTSQNFGNFYLHEFDKMMTAEFGGYYGRYVDDFYIMSKDKNKILEIVHRIREELSAIGLTLHDDKVYVQRASHGVVFIGSVVKCGRIYSGSRTIDNMVSVILHYNNMCGSHKASEIMSRLNSYLGFMRHTLSYAIRWKVLKMLNVDWWDYIQVNDNLTKVSLCQKDSSIPIM